MNTTLNKSTIMTNAWKMVKEFNLTMSEALTKAWANAKAMVKALANVTEEVKTWFGWKQVGMEVIHESKCLFQVTVFDPKTKNGTRVLSFFGKSQVEPIAE